MPKSIKVYLLIFLLICGCSKRVNEEDDIKKQEAKNFNEKIDYNEEINSVKVLINDKEYTIELENNETAKSFVTLLPLEFMMNELNKNEKYVYLDNTLPTDSKNVKHINSGDVMLYGNNCLVIFYKSFDTSYSYTKIGYIKNMPSLNNENISVKIEK